jgi:hypothetical protein
MVSAGSPVMILTSDLFLPGSVPANEGDLRTGKVALVNDEQVNPEFGYYAVLPSFIEYYSEEFPDSLVYVGACYSARNESMANSFLDKGAKTYLGYTKPVTSAFAYNMATEFFSKYFSDPEIKTGGANGAFTPGKFDPYCDNLLQKMTSVDLENICTFDPERDAGSGAVWFYNPGMQQIHGAEFKLLGSEELEKPFGLMNSSFETKDFSGWRVWGTQHVLTQLGEVRPTHGKYMAMISNIDSWLGIGQEFCIPPGAKKIEFDWNFISEEPANICSRPSDHVMRYNRNDTFRATLYSASPENPAYQNLNGWIGVVDQCSLFKPTSIDLPGFITPKATGWQHASYDISDFADQTNRGFLDLSVVHANYNNDGYTAVLIDNIRFTE